jgi:hypothetical protein
MTCKKLDIVVFIQCEIMRMMNQDVGWSTTSPPHAKLLISRTRKDVNKEKLLLIRSQ